MRLTICTHNLTRHPRGISKFILPSPNPFLFNAGAVRLRQVRFCVAVHKECDRKHIAVCGLMAHTLACLALYSREIRAATLVRAGKATLGRTRGFGAGAVVGTIIPATVVSMGTGVMVKSIIAPKSAIAASGTITSGQMIEWPSSRITIAFYPKHPWIGSLNVKGRVVIRRPFPKRVVAKNTMDPRMSDIPDPSSGIEMEHGSDPAETKEGGKKAVVILVPKNVDMRLDCGDDIRVFRRCDSMKEHVSPGPWVDEDMLFSEEAEV
jgi:hypothetical protein